MNNIFISYNKYKQSVLNETYESFIELKKLSRDIYEFFKNHRSSKNRLHYIKNITKHDYSVIQEFVDAHVGIIYYSYRYADIVTNGSYIMVEDYYDGLGATLNTKEKTKEELKEKYPFGIIVIFNNNEHTIIHELEHAYDDFRAEGKMLHTKMGHRLSAKHKKLANIKDDDKSGYEDSYLKTYYRTPHEMSAYFVKALNMISFFEDENEMILRGFRDIYEEFKEIYQGYSHLTPKDKKILARKLSQYYHKLKERKIYEE